MRISDWSSDVCSSDLDAANYPWVSQALWLYSQMVRWGHAAWDAQALEIVRQVFQPQIYRRALIDAGTPLSGAMEKVEGSIAVPTGVGTFRGRLMLGPEDRKSTRLNSSH